MTYS
jgi:sugar phosphate permease